MTEPTPDAPVPIMRARLDAALDAYAQSVEQTPFRAELMALMKAVSPAMDRFKHTETAHAVCDGLRQR